MHMAAKGGAHRLWEGRAWVGMGSCMMVAFTNFRVWQCYQMYPLQSVLMNIHI